MKACAVIPSRLASTRLPRKVLADIHGIPLLWYVWNRVRQVSAFQQVFVATDSQEVCTVVESWGGQVLMTSSDCRSGTERIASVLDCLPCDLIFNVQGDEPLIDPKMLEDMIVAWEQQGGDIMTPVYKIRQPADLLDPNIVKVARAHNDRAVYFSRSPIPFVRDFPPERWLERQTFWGHAGVYAYRREVLDAYPGLPVSLLESAESLEQLRFLDAGYNIQTVETRYHPIAVDTYADLERVRKIIEEQK